MTGYDRPWHRPERHGVRGPWNRDRFRHRGLFGQDDGGLGNGSGAGGVFAALDLGTNNCRLLVARPRDDGFRVIDAFSRIVRLGEGLGASGSLSEAAMERTIEALKVCASKIRKRGVTHARHVATEACRRASNCAAFVERVAAETGLALEIISSREEAELALAGCAPLLDMGRPYALVFDIGGGSTEVLWLKVGRGRDEAARRAPAAGPAGHSNEGARGSARAVELIDWMSLPYGVVGLSEAHGATAPLTDWFDATAAEIAALLAPFERRHQIGRLIADGAVQMLGSSGTVTTLAGVHLKLPRYDRSFVDGTYLAFDDIDRVNRQLADLDAEQRATLPCIGRDRADLVVAGCAILAAICRTWPVGSLRVADRGVREGILMRLMRGGPGR